MALLIGSTKSLVSIEERTGNLIKSYKQCENIEHGITILQPGSLNGVFAIQNDRPLIHSYLLQKEAIFKRHVLPCKLGCISISPNGMYLAAGMLDGSVYVWALKSGSLVMLRTEAHLQAVSCIEWSKDSTCMVSCGYDARVLVWRLVDIINQGQPVYTLTTHTLPVTSAFIGNGTFREARLFTASQDGTCCVFDLVSGVLLYTLVIDSKINAMAVDPLERAIYFGTAGGIHCVPLYVQSTNNKIVPVGSEEQTVVSTKDIEFVIQRADQPAVTALKLNPDGTQLISGLEDGQVISWEVGSKQLLKRYRTVQGKVVQIEFVPSAESNSIEIPLLQRTIEQDLLPLLMTNKDTGVPFQCPSAENELEAIYSLQTETPTESSSQSEEIENLKKRNEQLQKMYDALWAKRQQS